MIQMLRRVSVSKTQKRFNISVDRGIMRWDVLSTEGRVRKILRLDVCDSSFVRIICKCGRAVA